MIKKATLVLASCALLVGCETDLTAPDPMATPEAQFAAVGRGQGDLGTVYVRSQGLYYDTFVSASSLPMHGPFQKLENGETDFGPGDPGYLGGRWWIDDGDGVQDADDTFLLCPLLGPGRTDP